MHVQESFTLSCIQIKSYLIKDFNFHACKKFYMVSIKKKEEGIYTVSASQPVMCVVNLEIII